MACCPTEAKYGYDDGRFEKAVDDHFHCSVCYNVLKDPVMCRNNEHLFCRECITEHLNTNSHTCPECNENLTVETLRRARVISNILSGLEIKCDYAHRGCQESIRLEELDSHVENCGFAPVKCSNEECEMIVNKREIIHHESTVCEYRKVKCHNCGKIEQDVEEIKDKLKSMDEKIEERLGGIDKKLEGMAVDVNGLIFEMFEKVRFLENAMQNLPAGNYTSTSLMEDILVAGGWDSDGNSLKFVEKFSWKKNVWERVCSMNVARKGATSFVYENQVFVAGGSVSPLVEVLNLNEDPLQWTKSVARVASFRNDLRSVVYQGRAVLFCTSGKTDYCTDLCLTPPYTHKQLCEIPWPPRTNYAVVAFEYKVLIFGGSSGSIHNYVKSVLQFDIISNQFKAVAPLPSAVTNMAGVRWGDQAVLIGGFDDDGPSRDVLMYDSKTGHTTELPPMLEERSGCAAVITGNTIVVMGGVGQHGDRLRSVEAFTLGGYSWRYLPAMNDIRSGPTATVLPTKS